MKKFYLLSKITMFLFFLFFISWNLSAQNVNIPDTALKTKLLNHSPVIDINGDGEIQVSEAQAFTGNLHLTTPFPPPPSEIIYNATGIEAFININSLDLSHNNLTSFNITSLVNLNHLNLGYNNLSSVDVSSLVNLEYLSLFQNQLTAVDVSNLVNLETLELRSNQFTSVDVSNLVNLEALFLGVNQLTSLNVSTLVNMKNLRVGANQLTSIDVSNLVNLESLILNSNNLTSVDVSNNPNLVRLELSNNFNLAYINLKNGNMSNLNWDMYSIIGTPNVNKVCVDDVGAFHSMFPFASWNAVITTYCSFNPAQFNTVSGHLSLDQGQGCGDPTATSFPNMLIKAVQGSNSYGTLTDMSGGYNLYVDSGLTDVSVESNLPSYYSILPLAYSTTFTGYGNTDTADFCIQANATVNDLNITVLPITMARPGFEAKYKIVFENIGTTTLNGQVVFQFDAAKQSFVSAIPAEIASTTNSVTFDYTNLQPFHTQEIAVTLLNEQPPIMQLGDILNLTATITPNTNDHTPNDNTFQLNQTVVNSMDPNDKQVLEGDEIAIADADEYLHYLIRFQNMGTASAINVVVTDTLSDQLDWNSIRMVSASDDYRVRITDDNFVEFIFENINLPHEAADAPGSHGYIAFKIKPKANIVVGDIITGKAAIYFDFNAPIITNTVSTEVVQQLATENFELANVVQLYPNPTSGNLYISAKTELEKVEVFSLTGKRLLQEKGDLKKIDLYAFSKGIYFLKITDVNGAEIVKKIVKK
ncbi:MAG TPA: T9SS type A sorting domain-containing protein [Flavobacteriaceae bacterium]|nr:T9SS type A sorting domain-containing protein [Flavobacteriaceae bacterium]